MTTKPNHDVGGVGVAAMEVATAIETLVVSYAIRSRCRWAVCPKRADLVGRP